MVERIQEIETEALAALDKAGTTGEIEEIRVKYLGRKAELTLILRGISDLEPAQRGPVGGTGNKVRKALEARIEAEKENLSAAERDAALDRKTIHDTAEAKLARAQAQAQAHARHVVEDVLHQILPDGRAEAP